MDTDEKLYKKVNWCMQRAAQETTEDKLMMEGQKRENIRRVISNRYLLSKSFAGNLYSSEYLISDRRGSFKRAH